MRKQVMYTEGITGISVEINHSEMVVLKGMAERAAKVSENLGKDMIDHDPSKADIDESVSLLKDIAQFITNMLPVEVMSLEGAYKELFGKP